MFLEFVKLEVYPATNADAVIQPEHHLDTGGLQAHAMLCCDVTLRFAEGCDFTIRSVPLLAVQQFLGTCYCSGIATELTDVITINNGLEKRALWDSVLHSVKAQQYMPVQKKYNSEMLAALALEAVVALIMACPERSASHQQIASLGTYVAELEGIVNTLREENTELKASARILCEHSQSLEADLVGLRESVAEQLRQERAARHGGCPAHYDLGAVGEVIDVCRELSQNLPENWDNAFIGGMYLELVKYVLRAPRKNGVDDLRKAAHYINIVLKELGEVV